MSCVLITHSNACRESNTTETHPAFVVTLFAVVLDGLVMSYLLRFALTKMAYRVGDIHDIYSMSAT